MLSRCDCGPSVSLSCSSISPKSPAVKAASVVWLPLPMAKQENKEKGELNLPNPLDRK